MSGGSLQTPPSIHPTSQQQINFIGWQVGRAHHIGGVQAWSEAPWKNYREGEDGTTAGGGVVSFL